MPLRVFAGCLGFLLFVVLFGIRREKGSSNSVPVPQQSAYQLLPRNDMLVTNSPTAVDYSAAFTPKPHLIPRGDGVTFVADGNPSYFSMEVTVSDDGRALGCDGCICKATVLSNETMMNLYAALGEPSWTRSPLVKLDRWRLTARYVVTSRGASSGARLSKKLEQMWSILQSELQLQWLINDDDDRPGRQDYVRRANRRGPYHCKPPPAVWEQQPRISVDVSAAARQLLGLSERGGSAAAVLATPWSTAEGSIIISNSGSSNYFGWEMEILPSCRVQSNQGSRSGIELTVRKCFDVFFYANLQWYLGDASCVKSISFGTRTSLSYRNFTSRDISCMTDISPLARVVFGLVRDLGIKPEPKHRLRRNV